MTTSTLIKSVREKAGITQEQLSNNIGVRVQRISEWENGKHSISLDKFLNICQILKINPKTLF